MAITIRDAFPGDAQFIADGNAAMARETEHRALDAATVSLGVDAVLADPAHGRYFIATDHAGHRIGQLLITYEWSDWRNGQFWWIQSVYVVPDARRQGVFRALYRHVEALARDRDGVCGLRLYVEAENEAAQRTYAQCGMIDAGYRVMETDYSGAVRRAGD